MNKALRVLSETPTPYGYVIRKEVWGGFQGEVMDISGGNDEIVDQLKGPLISVRMKRK